MIFFFVIYGDFRKEAPMESQSGATPTPTTTPTWQVWTRNLFWGEAITTHAATPVQRAHLNVDMRSEMLKCEEV